MNVSHALDSAFLSDLRSETTNSDVYVIINYVYRFKLIENYYCLINNHGLTNKEDEL